MHKSFYTGSIDKPVNNRRHRRRRVGAPLPPFIFKLSRDHETGQRNVLGTLNVGNLMRSLALNLQSS